MAGDCVVRLDLGTGLASRCAAGSGLRGQAHVWKAIATGEKLFKVRRLSVGKIKYASQCL